MTRKEIIQALKDNEKPLCAMSAEMRKYLLGCKADDLEYLSSNSKSDEPIWLANRNTSIEIVDSPIDTYRLRPDYKDEPEVEKCETYVANNGLLSYLDPFVEHACFLSSAIDRPNFIGYQYDDEEVFGMARVYIGANGEPSLQLDANEITKGKYKVLTPTHVLFRKEADGK